MGFDDMDHDDSIFHDIVGVLTDEEYFSKVGFDQRLLSISNLFEKDGTYYWPINSRHRYIQRGRFKPENPEETGRLERAIICEQQVDTPAMIFINFGDLLAHIPVVERRKWKEHFREIRSPPQYAEKLLLDEGTMKLSLGCLQRSRNRICRALLPSFGLYAVLNDNKLVLKMWLTKLCFETDLKNTRTP
jgi:hypothetical protein